MDVRGFDINKRIYKFEARILNLFDILPKKHKHSLQTVLLQDTMSMRRCTLNACRTSKYDKKKKLKLFCEAQGFADNIEDSLCHMNDLNIISNKIKAVLDIELDEIHKGLSKFVNSFSKEIVD